MEQAVYNQSGKKVGTTKLPEGVFDLKWNGDLVHQVVTSLSSSARTAIAHTKTRGEVSGTGKKPWQQKGTGRARHGSRRSPIWRTGGITFGPRNDRNFFRKVNKKMLTKALFVVLSMKARQGEILFLDALNIGGKAKEARKVMDTLGTISGFETFSTKKKNNALIFFLKKDENVLRGFRNFGNMRVALLESMSIQDILDFKHIVIVDPEASLAFLEKRFKKASSVKVKK